MDSVGTWMLVFPVGWGLGVLQIGWHLFAVSWLLEEVLTVWLDWMKGPADRSHIAVLITGGCGWKCVRVCACMCVCVCVGCSFVLQRWMEMLWVRWGWVSAELPLPLGLWSRFTCMTLFYMYFISFSPTDIEWAFFY